MEKSFHPLKGVAEAERSGRRADRNQTLSRQLRSLVPALSYCPDAEPPLNVSGDLLSAEYAPGHRACVCMFAGDPLRRRYKHDTADVPWIGRLFRVPPITATLSILGSLQANQVK